MYNGSSLCLLKTVASHGISTRSVPMDATTSLDVTSGYSLPTLFHVTTHKTNMTLNRKLNTSNVKILV